MAVYLDASALVKLVIEEDESAALLRYLRRRPDPVSSALSRVEVMRAVGRQDEAARTRAEELLASIQILRIDDAILSEAASLRPHSLRSLDAIHLASARALRSDLDAVVAYDERMLEAAKLLGLETVSPR